MKKYIIYTISLLFCNLVSAQLQTVNINTLNYSSPNLEGKYYKDIDGNFDPFIGIWKGIQNNKTIIVNISKGLIPATENNNYSQDILLADIQIIEGEGTQFEIILCDTETEFSQFDKLTRSVIHAASSSGITMSGSFTDNCHPRSREGEIVMTIQNSQAQTLTAHWEIKRKGLITKSNPKELVFVTPTDVILTKQP